MPREMVNAPVDQDAVGPGRPFDHAAWQDVAGRLAASV
jgi:hypothetical protein